MTEDVRPDIFFLVGVVMNAKVKCLEFGRASRRILQLRKTTDVTPGSRVVHLSTRGRELTITTVNADGGARERMVVEEATDGDVCVNMDMFDKLVSCIPQNGELSLSFDGSVLVAKSGRIRHRLPTAGEFVMSWPELPKPPWFVIEDGYLQQVIKSVIWATRDDPGRLQCWAVHMSSECSEATDTSVMARLQPGVMPKDTDIFVPADAWPRIRAFVDGRGDSMAASVSGGCLWVDGADWVLFQRLLPQIDYFGGKTSDLIFDPDNSGIHHNAIAGVEERLRVHAILVNREELLSSCRHVLTASEIVNSDKKTDGSVRFLVKDDKRLSIVSHYPHGSSVGMEIDEDIRWTEDLVTESDMSPFSILSSVCFSSSYMVKALGAMTGQVVRMLWARGANSHHPQPIQFHDLEGKLKMLVGPRRL